MDLERNDFRAATYEAGATGYGFAYVQSHCAGSEVTKPMPNAITTSKGEKVATTEYVLIRWVFSGVLLAHLSLEAFQTLWRLSTAG